MIKINLNSEKKKKIEEYHLQYANQYIKPNLQKKIKESEKNRKICDFYKKLNCEFENIIIGEPSVLRGLVEYTEEYSCENNLYSVYNEALTELYIQSINKNEVINYIEKKIGKHSKSDKKSELTDFKKSLEKNYDTLNENNDEDLKRVKDKLKKEYKKHFDEEITEIFNYSSFNNKKLEGKFAVEKIVDKINEKIRSVKLPEKKQQCLEEMIVFISRYIDENKNELSKDKIDKIKNLENYIKNISVQYKIGYIRELLYKKIDELFSVKNWGAYPLLRQIDIKVCPYCNRQYISIDECEINKSSSKAKEIRGKTRPELDHFLSKSKFPFYSMSLYNLIPSCHVCNSNLKSDVNFIKTNEQDQINKDYIEALNPYEDGFNENYLFSINPNNDKDNNYDFLFENSLAFNIGFKKHICDSKGAESIDKQLKIIKRAEGNENIFHLQSLYNKNHKDIVYELIQIAKIYNEEYLDELLKNYSHIFRCKKDIMRMVLSNYIDEKDIDKRVMGKLVHDISKQLGLLEYLE